MNKNNVTNSLLVTRNNKPEDPCKSPSQTLVGFNEPIKALIQIPTSLLLWDM